MPLKMRCWCSQFHRYFNSKKIITAIWLIVDWGGSVGLNKTCTCCLFNSQSLGLNFLHSHISLRNNSFMYCDIIFLKSESSLWVTDCLSLDLVSLFILYSSTQLSLSTVQLRSVMSQKTTIRIIFDLNYFFLLTWAEYIVISTYNAHVSQIRFIFVDFSTEDKL